MTTVDVVQFKFNNLDPSSYARAFSFDINASKPNYTRTFSFPPPSYCLLTSPLSPSPSKTNSKLNLTSLFPPLANTGNCSNPTQLLSKPLRVHLRNEEFIQGGSRVGEDGVAGKFGKWGGCSEEFIEGEEGEVVRREVGSGGKGCRS